MPHSTESNRETFDVHFPLHPKNENVTEESAGGPLCTEAVRLHTGKGHHHSYTGSCL